MTTITIGFDITKAAVAFSQISVVLAGFAFAVLSWMVQNKKSPEDEKPKNEEAKDIKGDLATQTLVFLALTFMGNVMVAILWGLLSGETYPASNRAEILDFLASSIFALITTLTFEAIVFVVAVTAHREIIRLFRQVFVTSLAIGMIYLWFSTVDIIVTQENSDIQAVIQRHLLFFLLILVLTIIPLVIGWLTNKQVIQRLHVFVSARFSLFVLVLLIGMSLIAIGFGIVEELIPDVYLPLGVAGFINIAGAVLMGWAITFLPSNTNSLEQALKNAIPNKLNIFGKLTEGHDLYNFEAWDKEDNIAILRYWFWNRTKTKQNRKRVFINELEGLLKQALISKTISRKDFEKHCPLTLGDGPCGFAVIIAILQHFQVVDVGDDEYRVKNVKRIQQLLNTQ